MEHFLKSTAYMLSDLHLIYITAVSNLCPPTMDGTYYVYVNNAYTPMYMQHKQWMCIMYYDVYQTQPSPVISMPQVVDADYCYVRALVENLFERLVNLVAELSSLI